MLAAVVLFSRCAQVLPLNGGARDLTPPKLIKSTPVNASVNFNEKVIEFTFDENIQVKDINNQLVVTPQTAKPLIVEARGKKMIVKFDEDLLPNTTYRLFFGNAVSDMHESNALNGLEYVFSTGAILDSLKLIGSIVNAFDLKPKGEVIVGLFPGGDSLSQSIKVKPTYLTKTDNTGNYRFSHLPSKKFRLIAFGDKNKNLIYEGPDEAVAYCSGQIVTGVDTLLNLKMFNEETNKLYVKKALSPYYGFAYLVFNREEANEISAYYKKDQMNIKPDNVYNDTCKVYYKDIYDTLRLVVKHPGKSRIDTVSISLLSKEKYLKLVQGKKVILNAEVAGLNLGKLDYFNPLMIECSNWIDELKTDMSKIRLTMKLDSGIKQIPCKIGAIKGNLIQLQTNLDPAAEYTLALNKGAITDKTGVEADSMSIAFKTTEPEDYASLVLKLQLPKKENYIVQLLNPEGKLVAEQYTELSIASSVEKSISFKNLVPGNYFVKIIEDENKNKKWDTGAILDKKQPELIYFNQVPIKLLANWDSESEWIVK